LDVLLCIGGRAQCALDALTPCRLVDSQRDLGVPRALSGGKPARMTKAVTMATKPAPHRKRTRLRLRNTSGLVRVR
jgi:hypothetical protein